MIYGVIALISFSVWIETAIIMGNLKAIAQEKHKQYTLADALGLGEKADS